MPSPIRHKGLWIFSLFDELRPLLAFVRDEFLETFGPIANRLSEQPAITRYRSSNANFRTQHERIIVKACFEPWPKLFQNLRTFHETDWARLFPSHVVCEWIGHSATVAAKYYFQFTDDDDRAIENPMRQTMCTNAVTRGQKSPGKNVPGEIAEKSDTCSPFVIQTVGDTSPETNAKSPGNTLDSSGGGAESGALDAQLGALLTLWTSLSFTDKAKLLSAAKRAAK